MTWAFSALAGAMLLSVGLALVFVSYKAQVNQVALRQQKTADEAALIAADYLEQARNTLWHYGLISALKSLLLRSWEIQQEELHAMLSGYGDVFEELTLVDEQGNELARVSRFHTFLPEELGSQADSDAFQQARQGQAYIAHDVTISPYSSLPVLTLAVPIEAERQQGVLMAQLSIRDMWDAMAQVEVGETGYAYLVDRDVGQLIAHSDLSRYLSTQGQNLSYVPIVRQVTEGKGQTEFKPLYQGLDGKPVIGAATSLPNADWTLVVELPTLEALAEVRQMLYLLAVLIVLGVVTASGLSLMIPRRIVQPLLVLREGAQEIGAGNLDHVIQVQTGDEIQDLAEAFNQMTASLKASRAELERWGYELESKVEERTQELAEASERMRRRALQLQASIEVAQAIASVRDLDQLLPQVTRLIGERFGWYHVGVFLLDEIGAYAVLRAASSEGGQRMIARGHKLKVGEKGIVGYVTDAGRPRIALDVGEDAVYFDTPELHGTRSEMALPLKVGDRVIGALDVQSTQEAAYDDEDVTLLSALANQVAIAIENARLFEQTQRALEEVQTLHRQYVEREWSRMTVEQRDLFYEYRRSGTPPLPEPLPPEATAALTKGQVVVLPDGTEVWSGDDGRNGHAQAALAAPIKLRDQVIGVLDLQETDEPRRWTEDDIALVEAISDQVALALENARLFQQTQEALHETEVLYQASTELSAAQSYNQVLTVLRTYTLLGQADRNVSLNLFDRPWVGTDMPEWSIPIVRWSALPAQAVHPRYPLQAFPSAALLLHPDEPTLITDIATDQRLDENVRALYLRNFQGRSTLFAPLTVGGRWIGYVNAIYGERTEFPEAAVRRLMALVGQAAVVVQNLRQLQELDARAHRERLIREITAKVWAAADFDRVLKTAAQELSKAVGTTHAFIRLGTPPSFEASSENSG